MNLWLPDGTPVSLKVVAIVDPSLSGTSLVVGAHNAGNSMPSLVYVRLRRGASLAPLRAAARQGDARLVPVPLWTAAASDQQAEQNQVGLELLLGIAIAYSAIGIASTSMMSVSGRKSELELLHMTGATRRQIAWIVAAESLVITMAGIAASSAISALVLAGQSVALAREAGFTPIVVPWMLIGAITAGTTLTGVIASTLPAWLQFRRSTTPGATASPASPASAASEQARTSSAAVSG